MPHSIYWNVIGILHPMNTPVIVQQHFCLFRLSLLDIRENCNHRRTHTKTDWLKLNCAQATCVPPRLCRHHLSKESMKPSTYDTCTREQAADSRNDNLINELMSIILCCVVVAVPRQLTVYQLYTAGVLSANIFISDKCMFDWVDVAFTKYFIWARVGAQSARSYHTVLDRNGNLLAVV